MSRDGKLARELVAAADSCLNAADRDFINAEFSAGEPYFAIDDALRAVVREQFPLPAGLVSDLRSWLSGLAGDDDEPRLRHLLDQVQIATAA